MKHFIARYQVHAGAEAGPAMAEFDADHYSVSASGLAHFYRNSPRPDKAPGAAAPKDELIGSVAAPLVITLDEETRVTHLSGADMEDELLDLVGELLSLDSVPDNQVYRITVTPVE